jgi:RHS repeat-associated protein
LTQTICLGTPTCSPVNSTYAYDESNRLISVNGTAYTWDNNGNLLNDGASTYAYDAANRLTSVSNQSTVSSYQYNGLGDRLSQTVNAATTNYVLDLNAGLTQVLSDGNNTYLYGAMRIGELQAGGMAYHLGDALGSVRQLADASGSVTLARNFEPYGKVLNGTGSGSTTFAFTGEQLDAGTGFTFLRARFYNSGYGRFFQRDTFLGDQQRPMSFNTWLYVYNSPTNLVDPSGMIPCEEEQVPRLCILANGGFIDLAHFNQVKKHTKSLLERQLPEAIGKRFGKVSLQQSATEYAKYGYSYLTLLPAGILHDELIGIALGIILDFQYGYERLQFFDPRCFSHWGWRSTQQRVLKLTGQNISHCSSFSNEDLPSDYLGFVSAATGKSFGELVRILGEGEQAEEKDMPVEYWGAPRNAETCLLYGLCDNDVMPWNYDYECRLKVYDPSTKRYVHKPWPSELTFKPSGFGIYWGKRPTDFVTNKDRIPTPGTSTPSLIQTPQPVNMPK